MRMHTKDDEKRQTGKKSMKRRSPSSFGYFILKSPLDFPEYVPLEDSKASNWVIHMKTWIKRKRNWKQILLF